MPDIRLLPVSATAPNADDNLAIDGATGGTRRMLVGDFVAHAGATRQGLNYLFGDGATSHRGIYRTGGARTNLAGAPLLNLFGRLVVPTASSTAEIWTQAAAINATALSQAWAHGLVWAGNDLVFFANGATPASDFRRATWAGLRTSYSGRAPTIDLRVTGGSATAPTLRVDGVVIAPTLSDGAGTDPNWLSSSGLFANTVAAYLCPAGEPSDPVAIIGHITDAESDTWRITGQPPAWVVLGGGAWFHDFTDGVLPAITGNREALVPLNSQTSFTQSIYDLTVNPDGLAAMPTGATRAVKFTTAANNGYNFTTLRVPFRQTRFTFWYYVPTGQPDLQILANGIAAGNNLVITGSGSVKDAWTQITVSLFQPSAAGLMLVRTASAGTAYLADVRGATHGAVSLPGIQGIGTLRDLTTIGGNQARLVGVRPVLLSPAPRNIAIFPLSTTGAFLTLGSGNPLAFTPQRIMRAEVVVATAGADLTLRRNSSSTNDIVTALTDIPSANTVTALTLIAAQTRLAAGETVWASLSAGTGSLILELADTL